MYVGLYNADGPVLESGLLFWIVCLQAGLKRDLLLKKWTFIVKNGPFIVKSGPFSIK